VIKNEGGEREKERERERKINEVKKECNGANEHEATTMEAWGIRGL